MEQLTESIRQQGVLNPIMVRPLDTGEYEVISGYRRLHACKKEPPGKTGGSSYAGIALCFLRNT